MQHKLNLLSFLIPMAFGAGIMRATENTLATILDLDNMMDMSMDSVETLPDFVTPPPGIMDLRVKEAKIETYTPKAKEGEAKPKDAKRFKIFYEVVKTHEVASGHMPVADGSIFSDSFMGTEEGIKYFKRSAMNILNVKDFAGATLKDVISGLQGAEFKAAITIRKTPNPAGGTYENVQVRPLHETPAV